MNEAALWDMLRKIEGKARMTDEEYNKIAAVVLMRLAQSIAAAMDHEVVPRPAPETPVE
jgi:hypothetical protein